MAKNPSRLILNGSSWLTRTLSTAAEMAPQAAVSPREPETVYRKLSSLGATGRSVSETLNEHMMKGKTLSKLQLSRCLKELRKYGKFDHALEIMEWMEKRKMNFSTVDYARRLELIGKTKGITAAENYFDSLPPSAKNHHATFGALLHCYCNDLISDKALAIFQKMDERKFITSCLPFNNLMSLSMRLGQPEKVPPLVDDMKKRKISLASFTYNLWMQSYGCLNDFEGVERVFNEIGEDMLEWTSYSNLATIYLKAGLFDKTEFALKKLEQKMGFRNRNRQAYHFLITLYGRTGILSEVNRVWDSLKSSFNNAIANLSYLVMLQTLANLKDFEGVAQCFKEWESSCACYDMRLADVVIRVFLENGEHEEAELIFDDAIRRTRGPFFKARERFMVFCLKIFRLDLALKHMKAAFAESNEYQWKPFKETLNAFFDYFCKAKDVDGAEELCNILKHIGCLDSNAYTLLIKTYIAAGRLAPDMRQRLEEDSIEINHELEDLLEKACPK